MDMKNNAFKKIFFITAATISSFAYADTEQELLAGLDYTADSVPDYIYYQDGNYYTYEELLRDESEVDSRSIIERIEDHILDFFEWITPAPHKWEIEEFERKYGEGSASRGGLRERERREREQRHRERENRNKGKSNKK